MLTFDELRRTNVARCESAFHKLDHWSVADWITATLGELGEAANVAKKIRRAEGGSAFSRPEERDMHAMQAKLADELADVLIYLDLLAARCGVDLGAAVRAKFNRTSDLVGSPIKL